MGAGGVGGSVVGCTVGGAGGVGSVAAIGIAAAGRKRVSSMLSPLPWLFACASSVDLSGAASVCVLTRVISILVKGGLLNGASKLKPTPSKITICMRIDTSKVK